MSRVTSHNKGLMQQMNWTEQNIYGRAATNDYFHHCLWIVWLIILEKAKHLLYKNVTSISCWVQPTVRWATQRYSDRETGGKWQIFTLEKLGWGIFHNFMSSWFIFLSIDWSFWLALHVCLHDTLQNVGPNTDLMVLIRIFLCLTCHNSFQYGG